jgi:predicted acylesterase/phospholipase RssA
MQVDQIRAHYLNKANLSDCDIVIEPQVAGISWADFSKTDYCIKKGEETAKESILNIKRELRKKKIKFYFKKFFLKKIKNNIKNLNQNSFLTS